MDESYEQNRRLKYLNRVHMYIYMCVHTSIRNNEAKFAFNLTPVAQTDNGSS